MNVLNKIMTSTGLVTCAEIGRFDGHLLRQFLEQRTSIWTCKYPERAGADGIERDAYDPQSSYVVLFEGSVANGQVIGGCRIIYAKGEELPIGNCSRVPLVGPAVEISRLFFSPSSATARQSGDILLRGMAEGLIKHLVSQGYRRPTATIRASFYQKLRTMGLNMARIGPDQQHGNRTFIPTMIFIGGESRFEQEKSSFEQHTLMSAYG